MKKKKKIFPLDVGGVAGGTKFSVHELFFKYPVDSLIGDKWLYGTHRPDDSKAAKVSNHDLIGLTHCFNANKEMSFNFPLFALIDFQGFRLSVMTTLPINNDTIVYGSNDAGKTVHFESSIHFMVLKIGKVLHLQPHIVNDKEMALCGDIEVHKIQKSSNSEEKLFYMLDLARVFPPACCLPDSPPSSIFFRMLRPELLQLLKQNDSRPLSSDGLSNWQKMDPSAKELNDDITKATLFLEEQVIKYAFFLSTKKEKNELISMAYDSSKHPTFDSVPSMDFILMELHSRGINMRYLGLLVSKVFETKQNASMVNFLIEIMLVRTIKNSWRDEIRKERSNLKQIFLVCLYGF